MHDLLPMVRKELSPPIYEASVRSLDNGVPDNRIVAKWIVNFLL
jgi:hypothetical protein